MSTGVVPMSAQPDYVHQPPAGYQQLAANYQALAVYGPPVGVPASAGRPPKGGAPADSTGYVAAAIARGYPVTVGISVGNGFNPDADGYITYAQGAGSQVNHEIVICGGWVQHNGQNFVRMKNSWARRLGHLRRRHLFHRGQVSGRRYGFVGDRGNQRRAELSVRRPANASEAVVSTTINHERHEEHESSFSFRVFRVFRGSLPPRQKTWHAAKYPICRWPAGTAGSIVPAVGGLMRRILSAAKNRLCGSKNIRPCWRSWPG